MYTHDNYLGIAISTVVYMRTSVDFNALSVEKLMTYVTFVWYISFDRNEILTNESKQSLF
jgi:hypothetical protein